ncbi:MAG: aminotransferase class IV [Myxococcota bacterium]
MSSAERTIWIDGQLVAWQEATVHVLSQSLQRGSLVFDVMACYGEPGQERVFGLVEHVDRFLASVASNGMELELDRASILAAIAKTVHANPGSEGIKLSAYHAGVSLDVLPRQARPCVAIAAFRFRDIYGVDAPPERQPARLAIAATRKTPSSVLSPQVKIAAGYTAAAVAKQRALREGFDDILFLDLEGRVAESSTQSFFAVEGQGLRTASLDRVLAGITRRAVIEIAEDEGIPIRQEAPPQSLLESASEAFLTGTTIDVWPVARIGERKLPQPVPGPVTIRLRDRLARVIAGEDPRLSPRWMQPVG